MTAIIAIIVIFAIVIIVIVTSPGRKLEQADNLVKSGNLEEAERIYLSIWSKHVSAPEHLANAYLKKAKKNQSLEYIKKALALPESTLKYEAENGLRKAKDAVILYATERAEKAFDKGKYAEAVSYAEVIASYGSEHKTRTQKYLLYEKCFGYIDGTVQGTTLDSVIQSSGARGKEIVFEICKKLYDAKRYSDACLLLAFIPEQKKALKLKEDITIASVIENGSLVLVDGKVEPEQISFAEEYADTKIDISDWTKRVRFYEAVDKVRPSRRIREKIVKAYCDAAEYFFKKKEYAKANDIAWNNREQSPILSRIALDSILELARQGKISYPSGLKEEIEKQENPLSEAAKFFEFFPTQLRDPFIKGTIKRIVSLYKETPESAVREFISVEGFDIKYDLLLVLSNQEKGLFKRIIQQTLENPAALFPQKSSSECKKWINLIASFSERQFAVSCLKTLVQKDYPAGEIYADTVIALVNNIVNIDNKLAILDDAIIVSKNAKIIGCKKAVSESLVESDPDKSLVLCSELENYTTVGDVRQKACFILAQRTQDLQRKHNFLKTAKSSWDQDKTTLGNINDEAIRLAESFFNQGKDDVAYLIYKEFPCVKADNQFLIHRLADSRKISGTAAVCAHLEETLELFKSLPYKKVFTDSKELSDIWIELLSNYLKRADNQPKEKAIDSLLTIKARLASAPIPTDHPNIAALNNKLRILLYDSGREQEEDGKNKSAQEFYEKAAYYQQDGEVLGRIAVCATKRHDLSVDKIRVIVNNALSVAPAAIKKDFVYRFALILIGEGKIAEASQLVEKHLRNAKLLNLCEGLRLRQIKANIEAFNAKLKSMKDGKMSLSEANAFYQSVDEEVESIALVYPEHAAKKDTYKRSIYLYRINAAFKEGEYVQAYYLLKGKQMDFLKSEGILRNMAVACLGIMEDGGLTKNNYKEIISVWLTAVYCDRLIVKSLDYTSWDDPYTFTLYDSLSETFEYDNMPENINFEDPSSSNIGIGAVQKSLLERSDAILSKGDAEYYAFYRNEIDAMSEMASFHRRAKISEDVLSPYVYSILPTAYRNKMLRHLDDSEQALRVGFLYGITDGKFGEYNTASSYFEACEKALESLKNVHIAFTTTKISAIKKFPSMSNELVNKADCSFDNYVNAGKTYNELLKPYAHICSAIGNNILSNKYAKFINDEIIPLLMNHSMETSKGLELLYIAYKAYPNNHQLSDNIGKVLAAVTIDFILNDSSSCWKSFSSIIFESGDESLCDAVITDIKEGARAISAAGKQTNANKVLDYILAHYPSKSLSINSAKNSIAKAGLQSLLNDVIDELNDNKIQPREALKRVYDIYVKDKDNDRICENLAIIASICIMKYIWEGDWYATSVKQILDSLFSNRSATFKTKTAPFDEEFNNVARSISTNYVDLISGNKSLKPNVKEGIRYLKKFKGPSGRMDAIVDSVL